MLLPAWAGAMPVTEVRTLALAIALEVCVNDELMNYNREYSFMTA